MLKSLTMLGADIRGKKISNVLRFIVNQQKTDQKVKLEMATIMLARILSQDIDEAVT